MIEKKETQQKTLYDYFIFLIICSFVIENNGTARFENCKQSLEYQHLLLLSDIRGRIFSRVRPFDEQVISSLERSMHRSL